VNLYLTRSIHLDGPRLDIILQPGLRCSCIKLL